MNNESLQIVFTVNKTPAQAFAAIQNVKGWWSSKVEGSTRKVGDEYRYRHGDLHDSTQKLVEVVPNQKLVWEVVDATLSFTKDPHEWKGTHLRFEVTQKKDKTEIRFTHEGLVPSFECFRACTKGWRYYVGKSLRDFIATGKGEPD